jgi:flagellar M-ring protein FliF
MAANETNMTQQLIQMLRAIPPAKKVTFVLILFALVGGFMALGWWANRPDYQVLFSNLSTADAGRIVERLKEKQIPFQLREGGGVVMVPDQNVYELRLELASEGLPQGRNVGFEIFDEMPFGTTEFVQRLKHQQALQGELARTIMDFDAVAQARVHIVTTNESLFVEPESRATASVVLRLNQGRALDRRQLQGIINLVACAVEGLKPENVTVVDMEGGLLSKAGEGEGLGDVSGNQFEYKRKIEQTMEQQIRNMLEPVIGANKVVAKVSAELDFKQVNISEERFDPESTVIRSEQRQKETAKGMGGLPSGSPDLKYDIYQTGGGDATASGKSVSKENEVINYEINRINKKIVNSVGDIVRLSAAVVIDGPYVSEKGEDGKEVSKFAPRSRREMKGFEDIVKRAIGFDDVRGDQVAVSNIPFAIHQGEKVMAEEPAVWLDYAKKSTKPLFNVFLAVLLLFFVIRPLRNWLKQAGQYVGPTALPAGADVPQLEAGSGKLSGDLISKNQVLDISRTEPEKIAGVIRSWIREGS